MEAGETGETGENNSVLFDPPLWRQRRGFVNEVLRKSKVTSVSDFGCGEGSLLSFLVQPFEESPITRLAGVDISHEMLEGASRNCCPWDYDREFLRLTPLTVDLYQGSIDVADQRFLGFDALVCMEVIEHLDPPVLNKFFDIVLGTYKPKVVIVTTPNVEFNVYFPQLKYGTPEATLRIEDHRFEWTRREFQEWGNSGAAKYNYSVEYAGVGKIKDGDPAVGTATQIAVFRDLNPSSKPLLTSFENYEHIKTFIFPIYDEPDKSYEEILDEIHYYLQYLCNKIMDFNYVNMNGEKQQLIYEPNRVTIEEVWDIHRIRQLCKNKDKLRDILSSSSDFTLINNNEEMIVHKEYQLDTNDNDYDEYNYFKHDPEYDEDKFEQYSSEQNWVTTTNVGFQNFSNGWKSDGDEQEWDDSWMS